MSNPIIACDVRKVGRKAFPVFFIFLVLSNQAYAQNIYPPWQDPPAGGIQLNVPDIENVPDLHGEIVNADLILFFAGNQFMVVPELLDAFRAAYPKYQRIFVETLPPEILARQIEKGSLVIGNLKITLTPDVYTAGEPGTEHLKTNGWFDETLPYARNRLAIMVYKGNPKNIRSLKDLGRPEIRVSMQNPQWGGVGRNIIRACNKVGGKELEEKITVSKVKAGTTFLADIHHRQTPIRIMRGESDAGPVWYTEAYFQKMIGNPIDMVEIPEKDNIVETYLAGKFKRAPYPQAASDFFLFLKSEKAQSIYKKYGFLPLAESSATSNTPMAQRTYSVAFDPPELRDAPPDIKDAVMLGYNILMKTKKYVPQYVGNKLNCRNCHFEAGRTKKGVSLVGVGAVYPKYTERHRYPVNLVMRTNDCFERSMNGRPLPSDSKEMNAVITYYQWISKGLPVYSEIPWLGLKHIESTHPSSPAKGEKVYGKKCAACHAINGEGTQIGPPLWGKDSFNDGASMSQLAYFAAFARQFMPQGNPDLTDEEALDVAAFATRQPRPHFAPKGR